MPSRLFQDPRAAVRVAHGAFAAWPRTSYAKHAAKLNVVIEYLASDLANVDQRLKLVCRKHGKPIKETHFD